MKKLFLLLLLSVSLIVFTACGGDDSDDNGSDSDSGNSSASTVDDDDDDQEETLELAGTTWKLIEYQFKGESSPTADPEKDNMYGGPVTYTFNESGSVVIDYAGSEYGTIWKQDGDDVTVDMDGFIQELDFDGDIFETENGSGDEETYRKI